MPSTRPTHWLVASAFLASFSTACVHGTLEASEITVTRQNLEFPGLPAELAEYIEEGEIPERIRQSFGVPNTEGEIALPTQRFSFDDAPRELPEGISTDLRPIKIMIEARGDDQDLAFVRRLQLSVIHPDSPDAPEVLLDYPSKGEPEPPPERTISLDYQGRAESLDPWQTPGSQFELTVWGTIDSLPLEPWAVDVSIVFGAELTIDW